MEIQAFCSYLQLFSRNKPEIQMLDNSWNFFSDMLCMCEGVSVWQTMVNS